MPFFQLYWLWSLVPPFSFFPAISQCCFSYLGLTHLVLLPDEEPQGEPQVQAAKEGCVPIASPGPPPKRKKQELKAVKKQNAKPGSSATKIQAKGELKSDKQKKQLLVSRRDSFQKRSKPFQKAARPSPGGLKRRPAPKKKHRVHRSPQ